MGPGKLNDNLIVTLSFDFGVEAMLFCDKLFSERKYVIANQLLKAALSIGANIREAQNAESIADFIHKMKISCKEADEAEFYLQLIAKVYKFNEVQSLIKQITSINRVLTKIISTSKQNYSRLK